MKEPANMAGFFMAAVFLLWTGGTKRGELNRQSCCLFSRFSFRNKEI